MSTLSSPASFPLRAVIEPALSAVSAERAAGLTLDLVSVSSPTGDTRAVTERFADELRGIGMDVEMFEEYPRTPVLIGRFRGGTGPTLILNGHLDTVPVPHPEPERRNGRVYGRGTADMKGALAAAVETLRAIREAGLRPDGDIILCAHGLHEAPGGAGEDLAAALRAGAIRGDAAIVLELGHTSLPIVQLGLFIFRAEFRRAEAATHELFTPAGTPNPLFAAAEAALAVRELNTALNTKEIPYAGAESIFLGQLHGGDFYNRHAASACIEGTRRYSPEATAEETAAPLERMLRDVAERSGVELRFEIQLVREGCRVREDHPLVGALRSAYEAETGHPLPLSGSRVVADAGIFQKVGGIPCLYHGAAGEGAHGDLESVPEAELGRVARVYLRTIANYLGLSRPDDSA